MIMDKKTTVKNPDFSKILKRYEDQWVALSEKKDRVISSGKTLKELGATIKLNPSAVVMKVPSFEATLSPFNR
ncbi:hypothetical protein A2662_03310 [Candidatus Giovannonibacteria bacterium RIFCSPHIGHO2_01_FULL_45_33]|uniref:DUF5678 domain-containing protein n=1 Tax=Candidatus Giovannonibacteria bacterium RIFCSPLOWO2_01_FULL_45_34 TaxID=1798351 RepID=A0A1F5X0K2_9BACT|nr:MAG: hypothetical protein A2662_03310 [Candidatus Giovannonibacteria bacterium RIFCSPHIGHO2_01_FULL_45_33]OGF70260.1 MAG: hypothetical protein A3C73_01195 [Candidatus Giovannonibacteria bacterium RIFCSPHIGHO2_02_FULL_44_11]OGF81101.1 MAG: hypothetical protein A2930_00835 [Candidatus Giovannonibacteria bacterium RIFCSPLOWO2_01_FULL_45_34]